MSSMPVDSPAPVRRMSAEDRRELVLAAAMRAFGATGYAGTTTDAVAREAGVSQPYVVRIFGTKLELFLEVFDRSTRQIMAGFQEVIDARPFDPDSDDDWERLGLRYTELVLGDRAMLQVMMHGFAASGEPTIGARARARMGEIFDVVRSTGCTDDRARDFVAQGMLLNVMLAMDAPAHAAEDDGLTALNACAFGDMLPMLREQQGPTG
jgi:AcrR family transcriptional regulator|nr:transcriptional regulator, TetR family [Aeromicrobium sp.]